MYGSILSAAFDWIGPTLHHIADFINFDLDVMSRVVGGIVGVYVPILQNTFAVAWGYLGIAVDAVSPCFMAVYDVMAGVVGWITGTAVSGT